MIWLSPMARLVRSLYSPSTKVEKRTERKLDPMRCQLCAEIRSDRTQHNGACRASIRRLQTATNHQILTIRGVEQHPGPSVPDRRL